MATVFTVRQGPNEMVESRSPEARLVLGAPLQGTPYRKRLSHCVRVKTDGGTSLHRVFVMENENPRSELVRLLKEQNRARQNEAFGGLSRAEQADYNTRAQRIHALEEIQDAGVTATE